MKMDKVYLYMHQTCMKHTGCLQKSFTPLRVKALGERCFVEAVETNFEPAYIKEKINREY